MMKSNKVGLKPSNEMINKLYLYDWSLLLQSYEENLVQIWIVNVYSENGVKYQMLVLNDSLNKPQVQHANPNYIHNLKEMKINDEIPEIAKLILLRIESKASNNSLNLLLYGCKDFFRICAILKNESKSSNSISLKQKKYIRPSTSLKIRNVYDLFLKAKHNQAQKEIKSNFTISPSIQVDSQVSSTILPNKWFLIELHNSHTMIPSMYVKRWKKVLSKELIIEAFNVANARKQAVLISNVKSKNLCDSEFKIYALPNGTKISAELKVSSQKNLMVVGPYQNEVTKVDLYFVRKPNDKSKLFKARLTG